MASVPVASIWWIGLKRPPNSPVCGPSRSSGIPSANTLPVLIRPAALVMSSGVTWLSVPMWSSLPQRPQFDNFLEASSIAFLPTLISIVSSIPSGGCAPPVPSPSGLWPVAPHPSIDRMAKPLPLHVDAAALSDLAERPQNLIRRERHVGQCGGAQRPQRVVDGVHHAARRAGGAGFARALSPKFAVGGGRDHMAHLDVRHLHRHRHEVIGHIAVEHLSALVIEAVLEQRGADTLHHAAANLFVDQLRIDDSA